MGNSHDQYSTFQSRTHSSPVEKTCPETGANADLFNDCVYDVCMGAGEVRNGFLLESGQGSLSLDKIYNNINMYIYIYVYIGLHGYTYKQVDIHKHTHTYMYIYIYIHIHMHTHTHV